MIGEEARLPSFVRYYRLIAVTLHVSGNENLASRYPIAVHANTPLFQSSRVCLERLQYNLTESMAAVLAAVSSFMVTLGIPSIKFCNKMIEAFLHCVTRPVFPRMHAAALFPKIFLEDV